MNYHQRPDPVAVATSAIHQLARENRIIDDADLVYALPEPVHRNVRLMAFTRATEERLLWPQAGKPGRYYSLIRPLMR